MYNYKEPLTIWKESGKIAYIGDVISLLREGESYSKHFFHIFELNYEQKKKITVEILMISYLRHPNILYGGFGRKKLSSLELAQEVHKDTALGKDQINMMICGSEYMEEEIIEMYMEL